MPDWSAFGSRFKEDREKATDAQKRAIQKQELVNSGMLDLWSKVRNTAMDAVEKINASAGEKILGLTQRVVAPPLGFTISYNRPGGERRTISADLKDSSHQIVVGGETAGAPWNDPFDLVANDDNQLELRNKNRPYTVETVVELMVSKLL